MKMIHTIKQHLKDPLKSFRILQVIIAGVCIFIPVILKTFDNDEYFPEDVELIGPAEMNAFLSVGQIDSLHKIFNLRHTQQNGKDTGWIMQIHSLKKIPKGKFCFRQSLSDYVYSPNSYLFGLLYCMAAMLYIFNGVVYLNTHKALKIAKNGSIYNILIGLSLIGVVLYPKHVEPLWHDLFSFLFFLLNIFVMIFVPRPGESKTFKLTRIAMGLTTLAVLLIWIFFFRPIGLLWAEWISLLIISSYLILMARFVEYKP